MDNVSEKSAQAKRNSVIGLTKTMPTIIKMFTVHNLTTVYGQRKGNCLNTLSVNMDMQKM